MNVICKTFGHWYRTLKSLPLYAPKGVVAQIKEKRCRICGNEIQAYESPLTEEMKSENEDLEFEYQLKKELKDAGIQI